MINQALLFIICVFFSGFFFGIAFVVYYSGWKINKGQIPGWLGRHGITKVEK